MTDTTIQSVQRGIIFVMAQWSGNAQQAHKHLAAFLEQHGIPAERLLCIDVDREPGVYGVPEFTGKIHGWGEAAVVREGRIVFVTILGKDLSRIQEHCEELLRVYEA
jgi:hypothetical protein